MQNLTHRLFWTCCLGFLGLLLFFANCQSETNQPNPSTSVPPTLQQLVQTADTLSADALAAEARKLPETWADTLFQTLVWNLLPQQNGPAIKTAMSAYEKIRPGNEAAEAFIHFGRGIAYQFAGRLDSADIHYKLAQDGYQKKGDKEYLIQVLDCRATNSDLRGRFDEAIALKYQILDLTNDEQRRMYLKTAIAHTLIAKGDTAALLELLQAPLRYFEQARDTFTYTWVLTAQANAFGLKNDHVKCVELHQKALLLRRQIGKMAHLPENLSAIARTFIKLGNWQEALDTVKVAEKILTQLNAKQGLPVFQIVAGEALFHLNRLPEADALLLPNFENARARGRYPIAAKAALLLSKSKKQQGKPAEALDFQTHHLAFKDSVYTKEKEKIIQETAAKYETREKQAQIASLERENQLARERNFWIGGLSLVLLLSGVWFARFRQRKLKEALEKDLAAAKLENDLLLAQEQMQAQAIENHQKELENNRQQLADFTAHLIEKKHQIEALRAKLGNPKQAGTAVADNAPGTNESDIKALFGQSLVTDSDWETFKKYFEKVFPDFLTRLKIQYPELSTAELRLVLLTKMGLKSKEIADLIGISTDSVYKVKYRFKKKMGVSEEELLDGMEV